MPAYNDIADIDVINGNMDKIDVQMKKNADSAQQSKYITSDEYSATKTYAVGDYCIRENVLYKCKAAITTGEAFDSNKWVQTTCGTEFRELNSNLYLNPSSISSVYSQASSSDCEYVIQQDGLYRLFLQTNIAIQDKTLEIALNGCAVSSHRTTNHVYEHTSILLYLQKGCVVNYNISQVGVECQAIAYILS